MIQRASLDVRVASGEPLEVVEVTVHDRISALFEVSLLVASQGDLDLDAIAGRPASLTIRHGSARRAWSGVCSEIREDRRSVYAISIVPSLWLAAQGTSRRVFDQRSDVEIALALLAEWSITPVTRFDRAHEARPRRAQRDESDFAFLSRIFGEAGVSFYFDGEGRLVLTDALHGRDPRPPLALGEHVTDVRVSRRIQPDEDRASLQRLARMDPTHRASSLVVDLESSALDLGPGVITSIADHPRAALASILLVTASTLAGKRGEALSLRCSLEPAAAYRPPRSKDEKEAEIAHDEDITVAHDRTLTIGNDERRVTGQNLSVVVGVNRASQIGMVDVTEVGKKHAVRIAGGTTAVMQHDRIELGTPGGAKITLEGSTISLSGTRVVAKTEGQEGPVVVANKSRRE